jgi:TRAP-type C4-dicarboxylate transport system permease small subunit
MKKELVLLIKVFSTIIISAAALMALWFGCSKLMTFGSEGYAALGTFIGLIFSGIIIAICIILVRIFWEWEE